MTRMDEQESGAAVLRRVALACAIGALATAAVCVAGCGALIFIPGAAGNEALRAAVSNAAGGEEQFLQWIWSPQSEALFAVFDAWYTFSVLPLAVIVGGVVAGRLSSGSAL